MHDRRGRWQRRKARRPDDDDGKTAGAATPRPRPNRRRTGDAVTLQRGTAADGYTTDSVYRQNISGTRRSSAGTGIGTQARNAGTYSAGFLQRRSTACRGKPVGGPRLRKKNKTAASEASGCSCKRCCGADEREEAATPKTLLSSLAAAAESESFFTRPGEEVADGPRTLQRRRSRGAQEWCP